MIHEALFSLWNCPGDLFKCESQEEWIDMVELQEFLHPGERTLLQKIMKIAFRYHQIEEFIATVSSQRTIKYELSSKTDDDTVQTKTVTPGLYLNAFCNGVDEVLEEYRDEIINLEDTFLKNPQLSLTFVVGCVEKYQTLFEALKSMIQVIQDDRIHGCLIMGKLHKHINCGVQSVTKAADKIMQSINTMFYRHLSNWIIYGDLIDIYNEFFICDAKCADENFLYPEQLNESSSSSTQFISSAFKRYRVKKPAPVRKFYIKTEMLPSNIMVETAETILFMGRIIWIVRNDPKQSADDKYQLKFKRDIWNGKDVEYYKKLQSLQNKPFNQAEFEKTIEECRLKVTKYLWKVMVDEAKLLEHLQLIRDYYALGRGELFQQFIVAAEDHLKETPTDYIITNLNFIFVDTARKMYSENDKTYLRFELAQPRLLEKERIMNTWAKLEINFDIHWPLHIIFHPKAMGLYNKLFCFLLRVKKTHIDLHKLWLFHKESKQKIDPGVWTLRNNLMFIVNNLQYYLQVDVIEAQFSMLKEALRNANEFEDVIRLHSKFLGHLLSKTFVMTGTDVHHVFKHTLYQLPSLKHEGNNVVYNIILKILQLCDQFCLMAGSWEPELSEPERNVLAEFKINSDVLIEELLRILYSIHEKASGNHLLQLLHRLDFNRWFSKNKACLDLTASN